MQTIEGCYTITYEAGNFYPCRWQEDENYTGWRWIMSVGYFEIQALCFPTPGEAWDWVYHQGGGDHQDEEGADMAELEAEADADAEAEQAAYEQSNQSRTRYDLYTQEGGAISGTCWTNDNLDQGWPSESATWDVSYRDRAEALKRTGGTHQGIASFVEVFLDGALIDRQGEPLHG